MKWLFNKVVAWLLSLSIVGICIWVAFIFFDTNYNASMSYGVTFDPENAGSLKLDTVKAFHTVVSDWKFKYVRYPIHWDKVETERGKFDFTESDFYMNEAAKNDVKMMLAVGMKTPRWPECHFPKWATGLSPSEREKAVSEYIEVVVKRYRNHPALEMWQVENEPYLDFGSCPAITTSQLKNEIALVEQLDAWHPTLLADTGELSSWQRTANLAHYFGTTLYRVVWNPSLGYWNYDWVPALYYRLKLRLANRTPENAFVVELQAEPWPPNMLLANTPYEEQQKSMDLNRLKKNIDFAHHVGMARAYLWGAEWWNWLRENGHNEIPDYISTLNH